jgi:DNA-binding protein Fis
LVKNEKISLGLEDGKRFYYPHLDKHVMLSNQEENNSIGRYELSKVQQEIISTVRDYPRINQKELIKRTGINRITLSKNLNKLMDLCILRKIPNGNKVNYEFIGNEELRYEILRRLLIKLVRKEIDEETFLELSRKLE